MNDEFSPFNRSREFLGQASLAREPEPITDFISRSPPRSVHGADQQSLGRAW